MLAVTATTTVDLDWVKATLIANPLQGSFAATLNLSKRRLIAEHNVGTRHVNHENG